MARSQNAMWVTFRTEMTRAKNSMEYRMATKDDLPELLELYKQLFPEDEELDLGEAESIWDLSEKSSLIRYFVALENGKIVSTCSITVIPNLTRMGSSFGVMENVITDHAHRRKGIGKKVMEYALQHAKENNCNRVFLLSNVNRAESHKFYEAIGFNGDSKRGFEIRF